MMYVAAVTLEALTVLSLAWWRHGWRYGVSVSAIVGGGELLRMLSVGAPRHPGTWAGSYSVGGWIGAGLVAWYFTFAAVVYVIAWCGISRPALFAWALVSLLGGLANGLMPVAPPWMAGDVLRAVGQFNWSSWVVASDVQPAAAFPSLHVAVPAAVAVALGSWRWGAYAAVTSLVVVAAGEHWVVDVAGGWVLALGAVGLAEFGQGVFRTAGIREDVLHVGRCCAVAEGESGAADFLHVRAAVVGRAERGPAGRYVR